MNTRHITRAHFIDCCDSFRLFQDNSFFFPCINVKHLENIILSNPNCLFSGITVIRFDFPVGVAVCSNLLVLPCFSVKIVCSEHFSGDPKITTMYPLSDYATDSVSCNETHFCHLFGVLAERYRHRIRLSHISDPRERYPSFLS